MAGKRIERSEECRGAWQIEKQAAEVLKKRNNDDEFSS